MDEIKKQEKQKLNEILNIVEKGKNDLENSLESIGESNLSQLKDFREAGMDAYNPDFFMFLERLNEQNKTLDVKYKYQRLKELDYTLKEPYFARIDLYDHQDDVDRKLYIGKFGYTEDKPIITDWRTKVASIYYRYRYPQKNVTYESPEGIRNMDLNLKRTFEIDNGQLIKYFNNDIQLDENEIIIEKIEGRTGGVLEDIVETIQLSQLDIIEADPRQVCIVQGCVGSGKSTVAIHKLAHIFFNYPNLIRPEKSILIAKNQILVGYLSTLFPKLGIFDINYKTIRELVIHIVFREKLNISIDLDIDPDTSLIDLNHIIDINKKIENIHNEYINKLDELFASDEDFALFASYKYSKELTPYQNLNEIIDDLNEEVMMQKESLKENPNSPAAWFHKENLQILRKIVKKINKLKSDIKDKSLTELAKSQNLNIAEKMGYRNVLLYLYLYSEIIGITKYQSFEYCVVDEGQDFSPLEYAFLSKVVLRGRFCILGDLNQSLESDGISSWEDIFEVIKGAKHAETFQLDTNYRSTKPIIDLANTILQPYTDKYLPKSINRKGEDPTIHKFDSRDNMLTNFAVELREDTNDINKSIGIICYNDELLASAESIIDSFNMPDEKFIKLRPETTVHYIPKGVYTMRDTDCKGLEFAKVYILGLNLEEINNFSQARRAFVAVTRAMNELSVFGTTQTE